MKRPPPQKPKNAPPGTIWYGGPIGWFSIALIIQSEELVPDAISKLFGIFPDASQTKDVPLLRDDGATKRIPEFGYWKIETKRKDTDEWNLSQAGLDLLRRLPTNLEIWAKLPASATARLSFGIALTSKNQGFRIDSELVKYAADRNIELDFDVYGDPEEDA